MGTPAARLARWDVLRRRFHRPFARTLFLQKRENGKHMRLVFCCAKTKWARRPPSPSRQKIVFHREYRRIERRQCCFEHVVFILSRTTRDAKNERDGNKGRAKTSKSVRACRSSTPSMAHGHYAILNKLHDVGIGWRQHVGRRHTKFKRHLFFVFLIDVHDLTAAHLFNKVRNNRGKNFLLDSAILVQTWVENTIIQPNVARIGRRNGWKYGAEINVAARISINFYAGTWAIQYIPIAVIETDDIRRFTVLARCEQNLLTSLARSVRSFVARPAWKR